MERFLKAKHWQIFLITCGLPIIIDIMAMSDSTLILKLFPVIMILFILGFFGWIWAIATGIQFKVPIGIKMKVNKFKIFFFIPLIYILLLFGFMEFLLNKTNVIGQSQPFGLLGGLIGFIPLHLFSMFCIFFCLYFVAKTFKTVELQREVTFSDFAGEFFLFWFFPIGIWIIQPKINRMIEN